MSTALLPFRLLFADFDGVLNSIPWMEHIRVADPLSRHELPFVEDPGFAAAYVARQARRLDPACVARLDTILTRTGAKLVVSSSWRGKYPPGAGLTEILRFRGLTHDVFGETLDLSEAASSGIYVARDRIDEIQAYLSGLEPRGIGVESYVILDDDAMERASPEHFVRTDRNTGLTEEDVARAIILLRA